MSKLKCQWIDHIRCKTDYRWGRRVLEWTQTLGKRRTNTGQVMICARSLAGAEFEKFKIDQSDEQRERCMSRSAMQ